MQKLNAYSHSYGESCYHIVFCPKYRHKIFGESKDVKEMCDRLFEEIAERHGIEIYEKRIMDDHVHLFVGIRPDKSVSDIVRYFKGASSRYLFKGFPWLREYKPGANRFWGGQFWSDGYFFRSVGSTTTDAVEFYIKASQDKETREKYYTSGGKSQRRSRSYEDPLIRFYRERVGEKEFQTTIRSFAC